VVPRCILPRLCRPPKSDCGDAKGSRGEAGTSAGDTREARGPVGAVNSPKREAVCVLGEKDCTSVGSVIEAVIGDVARGPVGAFGTRSVRGGAWRFSNDLMPWSRPLGPTDTSFSSARGAFGAVGGGSASCAFGAGGGALGAVGASRGGGGGACLPSTEDLGCSSATRPSFDADAGGAWFAGFDVGAAAPLTAVPPAGADGAKESVKAGTGGAWVGGEEPRWL